MSRLTSEFQLASGNYPPPPAIDDFSPEAIDMLAELKREAPAEPSTLDVSWWAVPTLDVTAGGASPTAVANVLGLSEQNTYYRLNVLKREHGVASLGGLVHRALSIGVLTLPQVVSNPEQLGETENALLQKMAAGMDRVAIRNSLVSEGYISAKWRVAHEIRSFYDQIGVRTDPEFVAWGHQMGYFGTLRTLPNARQYIRAMSQTSRARSFLNKLYPEAQERLRQVPNATAIGAALLVPHLVPRKTRGSVANSTRHRRWLEAWLTHEREGLQDWAEAEGTTPHVMATARDTLVEATQGYIPLEDLLTGGAEAAALDI